MTPNYQHMMPVGRAACRALLSAASLSSEAPTALRAICRIHTSQRTCTQADGGASTSGPAAPHRAECSPASGSGVPVDTVAAARPWARLVTFAPATAPLASLGATLASPSAHLRALHTSSSSACSSSAGGTDSTPGQQHQQQQQPGSQAAAAASTEPVRNPMQAALEAAMAKQQGAAEQGLGPGPGAAGAAAGTGGRRRPRTWMWYDEKHEREERERERRRERYEDAGMAHLMDVQQSMKKMNRVVKLVRGLPYSEAQAQCELVPHKASMFVSQALERAFKDATDVKGLRGDRLVVSTIYVTKGEYNKNIQPTGRGGMGRKVERKSHLRVVLRESRGSRPAFTARVVPPLMAVWTGAGAGPARWLAAAWRAGGPGAGAGAASAPRQRFAYRLEV